LTYDGGRFSHRYELVRLGHSGEDGKMAEASRPASLDELTKKRLSAGGDSAKGGREKVRWR
jgi:hypothetical protein